MRELLPELRAMLDSGHCTAHTSIDIFLTDGQDLFVSSAEWFIRPHLEYGVAEYGLTGPEKEQQYIARIRHDNIHELSMSLDIEVDMIEFQLDNLDKVIGQLLTTSVRRLDGAELIVGTLFLANGDNPENAIWDARMPGFLISGQVTDSGVDFTGISIIDGITVSGRTVVSEFQWQEPISNTPSANPNDVPPTGGILEFPEFREPRIGRYNDFESSGPLIF